MKTGLILMLLSVSSIFAKAPMWEDSSPKRIPAQVGLPTLDRYLDLNCHELTDEKSQDEFIRYFSRASKEVHPNICSIVKEEMEMDSDVVQSEKETIGLGTFSHMVEAHFNEFIIQKRLTVYQDMDCVELIQKDTQDGFLHYLRSSLSEDGIDLCANIGDVDGDSDQAQATMPIGRGTYSKVIESYYESFLYRQ